MPYGRGRRAYRLTLTLHGKKVLASLVRCARRHERALDGIVGGGNRKRFLDLCKKIAARIE